MTSSAEIHLSPCWTLRDLRTIVGYTLHKSVIALRAGAKNFENTKCRCGKIVDELGIHGLSCT